MYLSTVKEKRERFYSSDQPLSGLSENACIWIYLYGHAKFNLVIWIIDAIKITGLWVLDDRFAYWDNI